MPPQKPEDLTPLDAIAFVVEIVMAVLLVFAGHGLISGWQGWAAGVFLAFIAVGIWAQWMAPLSTRRLEQPTRVVVQIMLFITVGVYAAAGGLWVWGLVFAVVAIGVSVALAREERAQ